jgi:hypothetical protein
VRYFAYIAEQSFKAGPGGERLFYFGGPWSRPYIIPDAQTEHRLFRRHLWSLRVMLGALILAMLVLFAAVPVFSASSLHFFVFFAGAMALYWIGIRLVLMPELRRLERGRATASLVSFYRQMAEKHSAFALSLGLGLCLLFAASGAWGLSAGTIPAPIAIFTIGFFLLCALPWGYALLLKRASAGRKAR